MNFLTLILYGSLLLATGSWGRLINSGNKNRGQLFTVDDFGDSFSSSEEDSPEIFRDIINAVSSSPYVPIVYWHGMGDCGVHVKYALRFIEKELPGVYIKSIQIGPSIAEDIKNSYFVNVNQQVEQVCKEIRDDPNLQKGYNAIGLSQGGQFLRAVAQRCGGGDGMPPMLNLISLGGQHQGVFGLPKCSAPQQEWCNMIDKLLTHVAYESWVQKFLVQAEYWHDPYKQKEYVQNSAFLADINNERKVKNATYKENLLKLRNFVLVLFKEDTIVEPKESEWFGFFKPGSTNEMVPLEKSQLYTEDWLGLKEMKEDGRLHFLASEGDHLQFTEEWFNKNILEPFLKPGF